MDSLLPDPPSRKLHLAVSEVPDACGASEISDEFVDDNDDYVGSALFLGTPTNVSSSHTEAESIRSPSPPHGSEHGASWKSRDLPRV